MPELPENLPRCPFIFPDWPLPSGMRALQTTRAGGFSLPPYDTLNLGDHVGDAQKTVRQNRALLCRAAALPEEPFWLTQVHGADVLELLPERAPCGASNHAPPTADAAVCRHSVKEGGKICAIMTADCLPVLFCDQAGKTVAAAHAGWRSLAQGVLENTLAAMRYPAEEIMVWLGPAIGPNEFEVGEEVRAAFLAQTKEAAAAFSPSAPVCFNADENAPAASEINTRRWRADIFLLARQRLSAAGVAESNIFGGGLCTVTNAGQFFSHRRAQRQNTSTGRMASLIWLE